MESIQNLSSPCRIVHGTMNEAPSVSPTLKACGTSAQSLYSNSGPPYWRRHQVAPAQPLRKYAKGPAAVRGLSCKADHSGHGRVSLCFHLFYSIFEVKIIPPSLVVQRVCIPLPKPSWKIAKRLSPRASAPASLSSASAVCCSCLFVEGHPQQLLGLKTGYSSPIYGYFNTENQDKPAKCWWMLMVDYQSPGSNGNLGYALFLDSTFGDKSKLHMLWDERIQAPSPLLE